MDETTFRKLLFDLPLGGVRYLDRTESSNDVALAWASQGAPDLSLVYAEEQTQGRGRMGRRWFTPPGSALAFSLVLRPSAREREAIGLFSGLGALALFAVLQKRGVAAQVKWPNDVLIGGCKTAGVLVETAWVGAEAESVVLGMGINVQPGSVPPAEVLNFPATCIEAETAAPVERFALLHDVLAELVAWRPRLAAQGFLQSWEDALAFRGQTVRVVLGAEEINGRVAGLELGGQLRLELDGGGMRVLDFGEIQLRPL